MMNTSGPRTPHPATDAPAEEVYTRLHISPLDPQLLQTIVPAAVLPRARHISYHTIQTRPDRPYGFVELPAADADKIKRKLNGAVLKGNKIRIEPARPDDMPKPLSAEAVADAAAATEPKSKKSKKERKEEKSRRDPKELVGVELEEGRKVKRGWTVTPDEAAAKKRKEREKERKSKKSSKDKEGKKDKKDKLKKRRDPESEYTEGPECLVKTKLPPNKRDIAAVEGSDDEGGERKKSKKHKKHDVVVHEFKNNLKFPTFFKAPSNTSKTDTPTEFEEGKGWVDDKGEVLEEVKSTRPLTFPKIKVEKKRKKQAPVIEDDTTSSSGSSSEEEQESDDEEESGVAAEPEKPATAAPEDGPSADLGSQPESASPRPGSAGSTKNLTIRVPPATPSSTKVHPLEALYKKQKQEEAKADSKSADAEPFSFFGGNVSDEEDDLMTGMVNEEPEEEDQHQPPMTPYSKQDFESRGLRSAAPTPDTAHPSRFSRFWPPGGERDGPSDVEEEEDDDVDSISNKVGGSGDEAGEGATNPNTEFQKWFWEHRGDLNRSWKKRRKMAAKEKRYRENRARADRAI